MNRISPRTAANAFVLIVSLWTLQGCSQMSTQSRSRNVEGLPEPDVHERVLAEGNDAETPPDAVSPAKPPVEHEPPVSGEPAERRTPRQPAEPASRETPSADAASPVSGEVEAPSEVTLLLPAPREAAPPVEPPSTPPEPKAFVHVVRWEGESLSLIAQWYTGSWQNWERVARANPGLNPDRIQIGNRIQVPEELVTRKAPLPRDFLPYRPGGWTGPETAEEEPTTTTGDFGLFGPTEASDREEAEGKPAEVELFEPEEILGKPAGKAEDDRLFGPVE
jgi:LysM repeat protein